MLDVVMHFIISILFNGEYKICQQKRGKVQGARCKGDGTRWKVEGKRERAGGDGEAVVFMVYWGVVCFCCGAGVCCAGRGGVLQSGFLERGEPV
ncbi:MAG: hypothetical protein ACLFRO_08080 [Desulfobacterales bacterium]